MTVVKINAITVPPDGGDELARRFAARAGAVDSQDGFEGFELLRPTDDRTTWLVVTRWRDEAAFEAWRTSPAFGHGHRQSAGAPAAAHHDHAGHHDHGAGHQDDAGHHDDAAGHHDQGAQEHSGAEQPRPVAVSSELWSFEIAGGTGR